MLSVAEAGNLRPAAAALDHLLLGISDLDRGIEWVEQRTGIRAAPGGVHPGLGTRNALLSLGAGQYFEIIAPDPAQSEYRFLADVRPFTEPRLVTFAAATPDIDALAAAARAAGFGVSGPDAGSRRAPSGETLRWRMLKVINRLGSGGIAPVPFFIQWEPGATHPSAATPPGCSLESIAFEHPAPADLSAALGALGIDGRVSRAATARIVAVLNTPKGRVELS